jgi:hypothetical protein
VLADEEFNGTESDAGVLWAWMPVPVVSASGASVSAPSEPVGAAEMVGTELGPAEVVGPSGGSVLALVLVGVAFFGW